MSEQRERTEERRSAYAWGEELGASASVVSAIAHLHGIGLERLYTLEEFEDAHEALLTARWG